MSACKIHTTCTRALLCPMMRTMPRGHFPFYFLMDGSFTPLPANSAAERGANQAPGPPRGSQLTCTYRLDISTNRERNHMHTHHFNYIPWECTVLIP